MPPPGAYGNTGYGGYGQGGTAPTWLPIASVRPLSTSLAGWLQALFWAVAVMSALTAITAFNARSAFDTFAARPTGAFSQYQAWTDADALNALVALLGVPFRLALLVVVIVWSFKAHKAASGLAPGPRKWSAGWTIGGWFIPFASIVIPKLVIDETEKIAKAPRHDGIAMDWRSMKVSGLGTAWWWLFIASNLLSMRFSFSTDSRTFDSLGDRGDISSYYLFVALAGLVGAVSAVFGALFVKDLSRRLSPSGLAGSGGVATTAYVGSGSGVGAGPGVATGAGLGAAPSTIDLWATRTAEAATFCEICREPLQAQTVRCPRCGKRRQPSG